MSDQTAVVPSLTARIEERILAPLRRSRAARTWFLVTVAAILALHAAVLVFLLYRDTPKMHLAREETPIEVVVEKPEEAKPPPPKAAPKPPAAKAEIEKPASSAPRDPSDVKVETDKLDKETHAPKAEKPLTDGKPEPAKDSAAPAKEAKQEEKVEEAEAKPDVLKKDAEALEKAVPKPQPRPKKLAKAKPRTKSHRLDDALQQLAGASALPDYKFARPTKKSRVHGGSEDSRYLAVVYGMIMQNRTRFNIPGGERGSVTIAFTVDDEGNLTGMGVQQSSGYSQVDSAAASAIRRASPFPPPPPGAPHGLVATIDFGEAAPSYTMGDRED